MGNHATNSERFFRPLFHEGLLYYDDKTGHVRRYGMFHPRSHTGKVWYDSWRRAEHKVKKGYLQLRFIQGNISYCAMAHRVIWILHNGDIPTGKEINHKNGIRDDNRLDNLELVTSSQNQKHAYANGLKKCNNKRCSITGRFLTIHDKPDN